MWSLILFLMSFPLATPINTLTVSELSGKLLELIRKFAQVWMNTEDADIVDPVWDRNKLIFSQLKAINAQINDLNRKVYRNDDDDLSVTLKMLKNLPETVRLELKLDDTLNKFDLVNKYYKQMENYLKFFEECNSALISFANTVTSKSLNSTIPLTNFLNSVNKHFEPSTKNCFCDSQLSLSQMFHNLMNEIMLINTKGFVVMQMAYVMKQLFQRGDFSIQIVPDAQKEFKNQINKLISTVKPFMARTSTEVWRCDPKLHIEGKTYVQITNFLHGYILNKANLDPYGKCHDECNTFSYIKYPKCGNNEWCNEQATCSKIINCGYIDASLEVCSKNMSASNKRYEYVKFGNGIEFGKNKKCEDKNKLNYLETYHDWEGGRCSYCFCLCEEEPKYFSDRYINLRLAKANISDNRVVTGVRFVKHNKIIHLQVQEGKLFPFGQIDKDSVQWVSVEKYKITDPNIYDGQDFFTLSYEHRGFGLNDIKVREGHVVAGVKFSIVANRLYLEVLSIPFNFTTGQLYQHKSFLQKGSRFKYKFSRELKLNNLDVPTRSPPSSEITTNKYVKFTNSGYDKDAGQTTVPFFDAQSVIPKTPVPLSGVGIFYKTSSGYGGFIAPKILTYNFTKHLQPIFPVK